MTPARRGVLGLLFLLAASCGGGGGPGPGAQPGDLTVQFSQSGPSPGAILFTVSGGPVTSVTALHPADVKVSYYSPTVGTTKVIVTGTLTTGDLLTLRVPDITASATYMTAINQVADNTTFALISSGPYSLLIHK